MRQRVNFVRGGPTFALSRRSSPPSLPPSLPPFCTYAPDGEVAPLYPFSLHISLLKTLAPSKEIIACYLPRALREGLAYALVLPSISFVWIVASLCRQGKHINTTYIEIDQVGQERSHPRTFWFLLVDTTTGASM